MSRRVVKQPNGLYAVFSTVVDDFIVYDATTEELEEFYLQEKREAIKEGIMRSIEQGHSISDCLSTIKAVHGEDVHEIAKKELGIE